MSAPGMQGPKKGPPSHPVRVHAADTARFPRTEPAPRGGPDHFFLFGRSASPLDHTGVAEPVNAPRNGLRPARSLMTEPALAGNAALDRKAKKKKQGIAGQTIHDTGKDTIMSQYRITATITSQTQATDSGAWQMGITWRKSLTLDPAETQEAADLRNQAWEQAANGIDDETTRRIWQQVDTVTAREAERLRAQVRKLIGLLNAGRPALDENGYPMWDHLIALSNRQCWQWEIAAAHSGCLAAIMQAAGIDDWPPADSMPDITNPVITINLSTNQ